MLISLCSSGSEYRALGNRQPDGFCWIPSAFDYINKPSRYRDKVIPFKTQRRISRVGLKGLNYFRVYLQDLVGHKWWRSQDIILGEGEEWL